jgi:hypothetical protein
VDTPTTDPPIIKGIDIVDFILYSDTYLRSSDASAGQSAAEEIRTMWPLLI